MGGRTIFDKVEEFLKRQEIYGNTVFFEKMPENPEKISAKSINKPSLHFQQVLKELDIKKENPNKDDIAVAALQAEPLKKTTGDWESSPDLGSLYDKIHNCLNCPLGGTRKNFVFGKGNPNADIMLIGEAPGADEDELGEPFVGRAGQLLTKILEAINLTREEVYIGNIIKCRPPGNRKPLSSETAQCKPYLMKQIELIGPEFILVLGLTAADTLLGQSHKMAEARGRVLDFNGRKLMITYHPSALLRNPNWKKPTWEDVKLLRKLYDEYLENKK